MKRQKIMQLAHLNWQEAEKVLADPETLVVIPVGSTEQHGPIGPLGTDWLIPEIGRAHV